MPRRIWLPSACTRIVSVTARSPLRSTSASLTKRRMRSTACAGPAATTATTSPIARRRIICMAFASQLLHHEFRITDLASRLRRLERDGRARGLRSVLELEERLLPEAEHARHHIVGEGLNADVQVAHGAVVVAARHLQLILDLGQLLLQGEKILVGLELRIGLGDSEQPP